MRPSFTRRLALAAALALAAGAGGARSGRSRSPFVPQENPEKLLGDVRRIGGLSRRPRPAGGIETRVTASTTRRRSRAWRRSGPTSPSWARCPM